MLHVNDLAFSYQNNAVLKGIDFKIEKGEIFCIFGTNGCGKTTLLDCILGLLVPDLGTLSIHGQDTVSMSIQEKAQRMAYVSQTSERTFPFTVLETVLMGRTAYSGLFSSPGSEDIRIAKEALESVGMTSFSNRACTRLSGGEEQLVKIARAIAQETDLIIFDEPTTHLDFRHELNIVKYIMDIVQNKGTSVIMATHAPNHALFFESHGIPTRVALMEDGVFGAVGTPSEVLTRENMAKVFRVNTRHFTNNDGDMLHRFIMPFDFCEEDVK